MPIAARIDEFGKPAWIVLMILGFWAWWPLGLAILAFTIGSGRMGCWNHHGRWQDKMDRMRSKVDWWGTTPPPSGNRAFDEYRTDTLRRLEEEQREFKEFLQRLRCQGPGGIRPVHGRAAQPAGCFTTAIPAVTK